MKVLIILMALLFNYHPQENTCKLDITDLVENAKKIGKKEFDFSMILLAPVGL